MWMRAGAVAVCLMGVVGFGAVNYGGVTAPSASCADINARAEVKRIAYPQWYSAS